MTVVLRVTSLLFRYRMGIVETDEPSAVRSMLRKRVVDPVRLLRRNRNLRHYETHPMATLGINNEHLPIQIKQGVKRRFALLLLHMVITLR